jgi:hypothetical protein
MAKLFQSPPQKPICTDFSNMVGATGMTLVEQAALHPIDTLAKAQMANSRTFGFSNIKGLYDGFWLAAAKKAYMRGCYKWPANVYFNRTISQTYGASLEGAYGVKGAKLAVTTAAAAATGLFEPVFVHPIDTLQVRMQAMGKTKQTGINVDNIRALGFSGLYRGALLTGVLRNVPGCIGLFSGSHLVNSALDNDNRSSITKDLFAKWCGAVASIVCSQPGDVVKTNMQVHGMNFSAACKSVPIVDMMTRGLAPRLGLSVKVGAGFLLAEKGMQWAGGALNGYEESAEHSDIAPRK